MAQDHIPNTQQQIKSAQDVIKQLAKIESTWGKRKDIIVRQPKVYIR